MPSRTCRRCSRGLVQTAARLRARRGPQHAARVPLGVAQQRDYECSCQRRGLRPQGFCVELGMRLLRCGALTLKYAPLGPFPSDQQVRLHAARSIPDTDLKRQDQPTTQRV